MRILPYVFLLLMGMTWRCVQSTCVFETDFGLSINCGLKKSGLFRVRNLGGVKGYVGVGLQLADELGFKESLSTLEQNSKRRSVNGFPVPGSFEPLQSVPQKNNHATTAAANNDNQDRSAYAKMNGRTAAGVVTVPPFRPLMAAANNMVRNVRLAAQQQQQRQLQQQPQQPQQQQPKQQQPLLKPLPVPAFAALPESIAKVAVEPAQPSPVASGHRQSPAMAPVVTPMVGRLSVSQMMQPVVPVALIQAQRQTMPSTVFLTPQQQQQLILMSQQSQQPQTMVMPQQQSQQQPMGIKSQQPQQQSTVVMPQQPQQQPTVLMSQQQPQQPTVVMSQQQPQQPTVVMPQQPKQQPTVVMSQQPQQQQQQQLSPVYYHNAMQQAANRRYNAFSQSPQNSIDVRPIIVMPTAPVTDNRKKQIDSNSPLSNEVDPASMMSLFNAAAANNVSVEQLAMALRQRQQQTFYQTTTNEISTPVPTTTVTAVPTTTTTTQPPPAITSAYFLDDQQPVTKKTAIKPYKSKYVGSHKVMNAPKEYYPVGYDKNFDDNFVSKVDLPDTTFSCGDQKHFPGLYGDEDLGCMVFHVCAFTDDGLTQKSFLCPESTLFDQTILKCNWWFYVDCKSSKKLYDSNIPISKSYQLMKALTFFSSYSVGPSMDASVAAATAAVSRNPLDEAHKSDLPAISSHIDTSPSVSNTTTSTEVLDNVSFRR